MTDLTAIPEPDYDAAEHVYAEIDPTDYKRIVDIACKPVHDHAVKLAAELQQTQAAMDRVVRNESNHYDRFWEPPTEGVSLDWLNDTEAKMREALTDPFCDDAAAIMLTMIAHIRLMSEMAKKGYDERVKLAAEVADRTGERDAYMVSYAECVLARNKAETEVERLKGSTEPTADLMETLRQSVKTVNLRRALTVAKEALTQLDTSYPLTVVAYQKIARDALAQINKLEGK